MASVEWRRIPTVLYPQEVLDKAFRRASKQSDLVEDPDKYHRVRKQMARMVQAASDTMAETLLNWIDKWPSLNAQSSFDQALVDAAVGADEFRKNLGAIQWAAERVRKIAGESQSKMLKYRNIEAFHAERRHAYGRMSSIIEQIGDNILWLGEARNILRKLPSIDASEPCIVVAGAPNVGKSALITILSSGEPEVAAYPFTTKRLHVGHFEHRRRKYQMVDTPGLLDRPMAERNQIEMQAIAALENVGDVILFLIDLSEGSGMSQEKQLHLMNEVKELLAERPMIVAYSKSDLLEEDDLEYMRISSQSGEGIDELRSQLVEIIDADAIIDPLELPDDWHRQNESIGPIGSPEEIAQRREKAEMHAPRWEREMRKRK
ncbi:MAG: 50S ribosome-binding GTPase [Candidatus Thalassarchaeaceae archaeon]|jgi:nucleolar GTP-binding protein|nr:50S ribosome-binding GTPase [Candidatus Thalassarchaeaceae archaeon]MDP6318290.1 50S ribosome-binding GTPase [Candidatus Thalassarchaeaceae archaeon]HIH79964.1 GTP-binding protein [Candidatus Thalassarchaeaceae archaeon]HJM29494.1 GTPase [Candidatus Thalassarchaeaceae archaeon]HJN69849.1 GTPase [Candidatus Thalassarchaeaceae archaeon]|tara:strand:+ start:594 stop:1721 length:1128 start_codon:yes stop_codon:yes gene_type:complete